MLGECLTDSRPADYDPYQALAAAIVKQAANDYVNDIRKLRNKRLTNRQWEMVIDDKFLCERFFRSKFFGLISDVDADTLIQECRDRAHKLQPVRYEYDSMEF